ncbi:nitroreductase family deazaflavin-dependent oxidoreductase [Streptomyces sp. MST-110588]|uniref:nitroreductase family deazaflavin-dependent oxidoreductase n=1 Tax=Streptomyces sp. MST-110588 TaxID=2833628 RepID=UPI001F5D71D3|nr:nitroreductase family deazaflavin-dependent oxidoreductase [Streptomyces sp. MST-110588]UNO43411.1 nitroreductase family deazaflavin-dependent oxidoreductase [Streptomyces sp. MST-110588]
MNTFNQRVIEEFRARRGAVGGQFEGRPLLLLTSTGAKSGLLRTNPVIYLPDGEDRFAVFASNGGAPTAPAWYHNLTAHPLATIEAGAGTYQVRATEAMDEERDRLWARQVVADPHFAAFQERTRRRIPVMVLTRQHTRP